MTEEPGAQAEEKPRGRLGRRLRWTLFALGLLLAPASLVIGFLTLFVVGMWNFESPVPGQHAAAHARLLFPALLFVLALLCLACTTRIRLALAGALVAMLLIDAAVIAHYDQTMRRPRAPDVGLAPVQDPPPHR